ncbi:hypothetical protein METBIDRAFT_48120 [Metschnikowia bicuspidata var. bicuspidata NRRL YB-4993]|uniref:Hyphally-regulated cell wall protein N-terminal domain-containing protein n=1 Tax=Metschnikowia bicuspidata var. bicuspidata NRRL YB-4993 TaxID=869754 RepID=A0A1A0GZ24_9ASCO|nr:hypothetical protein METBIDRAFT_48120 [Metschnikowia bicuspidata var. bicuspidata NRRL YB-4993]OBA16978.1 hypothetical protein METBIDRAFT_48120 [Metschnikowia bicuspidata var. bicuspidata NRRL YB-4993]
MKLSYSEAAFKISICLGIASSFIVRSNTVEITTGEKLLEDLLVKRVNYSIVNSPRVHFVGHVYILGSLLVSSTNNLEASVRINSDEFTNYGTVAFNTIQSDFPSTYYVNTHDSFINTGSMFFGISGATSGTIPFRVTSVKSWNNTGMMIFWTASGESAQVLLAQDVGHNDSSIIKNSGSICLYNTMWQATTSIAENGCITIGTGSAVILNLALNSHCFSISKMQTFYLEGPDSVLTISGLNSSCTFPMIKVAGFGNENVIEFDIWHHDVSSYEYLTTRGELIVKVVKESKVVFHIGTGYLEQSFRLRLSTTGCKISYSPHAPNIPPYECSCQSVFPEVSGATCF